MARIKTASALTAVAASVFIGGAVVSNATGGQESGPAEANLALTSSRSSNPNVEAQEAQPIAAGDRLTLKLTDSVSLEVMALTDGTRWWTPSGELIEEPQLSVRLGRVMMTTPEQGEPRQVPQVALVVRLVGDVPSDASIQPIDHGQPRIDPEPRWYQEGTGWQRIPHAYVIVRSVTGEPAHIQQDLQVGVQPFRTVARFDSTTTRLQLDTDGQPVAIGKTGDTTVYRATEGVTGAVVNAIDTAGETEVRVALYDDGGVPAFGSQETLLLPNGTRLTSATIPNLTSSQIRAIEFQRRPVIRVRMKVPAGPESDVKPELTIVSEPATRTTD